MLSSQSLRVRWDPPPPDHQNGILQGYKVMYKHIAVPVALSDVEVKKTTSLETDLHGLARYANYSIRVLAFTLAGEGIQSKPVHCMTEEDVPGPPGQVKALAMTSESILVAWTRPSEPNGAINKYYVFIQNANKEVIKEVVYGDKDHTFECRRLKEFARYKFWVSASTNAGEGQASIRVTQSPLSRVPARIASFSKSVVGSIGSRVSLGCHTVGLPAPTRVWRGPSGSPLPTESVLIDGTLVLGPLSMDLAGNYTCLAENVFGRDQVVYHLSVTVIPGPPALVVISVTMNSLTVQWKLTSDGGSPVIGYKLSYRKQQNGIWEEIFLEPDQQIYTLSKLQCGSAYEIYIQAKNSVGQSKPSHLLSATTKGHMPNIPEMEEILLVNSTSAMVYLESWPTGGCPVQHFSVSYKSQHDNQWHIVGTELSPFEDIVLPDLIPSTRYSLRINAYSEAGVSHKEYVFATRSKTGEIIPLELIPEQRSSVLEDLNIIVPIMSGIICSLTFSICSWKLYRKRSYSENKSPDDCRSKSLVELENQRNTDQQGHTYSPSPPRKADSSLSANKGSDTSGPDYEIYPYATFNLPSQPVGHSLQFQTFNQHDCYEGRPVKDYHCARVHKPSSSNSPPDGLSLEISCISSQQTMPVRRKGGTKSSKNSSSTAFICDSDSSGGSKPHSYRHHKPSTHTTCNTGSTVYELDSSTESADASPEVCRTSLGRRTISLR